MKLAVVFPGIGYHKDKPLLYYASKLVSGLGYDIKYIEYSDMPAKIRGNAEMMKKAVLLAYDQSIKQLKDTDLKSYEDIIFIGKSIGTVAMAKYTFDNKINARQIWYTPVEATFMFAHEGILAFIGDADPWSDVDNVKKMARDKGVTLYSYPGCNHSLECDDVDKNLVNIRDVMNKTKEYINDQEVKFNESTYT